MISWGSLGTTTVLAFTGMGRFVLEAFEPIRGVGRGWGGLTAERCSGLTPVCVCVCVNYIILLISKQPEGAGPGNYYTGLSST